MSKRFRVRETQEEITEWADRNFGEVPAWHPLLGLSEEVGKLSHHYLKREQGIRGTAEYHSKEIGDAVGDIFGYLVYFCAREGLDAESIFEETWSKVRERDWKKDKNQGVTGTPTYKERELPKTGTICAVCDEPQMYSPSGVTCPNGHGEAPSKE